MRVAMKHARPHDAYIKMSNDITFSCFPSNIRDFQIQWHDGRENVKKKKRFDKQNKTFSCASHFLYISLPFLYDYSMKMPNFTFYGEHKQASTIFDKVSR